MRAWGIETPATAYYSRVTAKTFCTQLHGILCNYPLSLVRFR
jgi:hypothetical protein